MGEENSNIYNTVRLCVLCACGALLCVCKSCVYARLLHECVYVCGQLFPIIGKCSGDATAGSMLATPISSSWKFDDNRFLSVHVDQTNATPRWMRVWKIGFITWTKTIHVHHNYNYTYIIILYDAGKFLVYIYMHMYICIYTLKCFYWFVTCTK